MCIYIYIKTPIVALKAVNCSYCIHVAFQTSAGDGQDVFETRDNTELTSVCCLLHMYNLLCQLFIHSHTRATRYQPS